MIAWPCQCSAGLLLARASTRPAPGQRTAGLAGDPAGQSPASGTQDRSSLLFARFFPVVGCCFFVGLKASAGAVLGQGDIPTCNASGPIHWPLRCAGTGVWLVCLRIAPAVRPTTGQAGRPGAGDPVSEILHSGGRGPPIPAVFGPLWLQQQVPGFPVLARARDLRPMKPLPNLRPGADRPEGSRP